MKKTMTAKKPQPFLATGQLRIIPLLPEQMMQLRDNPKALLHSLSLVYDGKRFKREMLQLISVQREKMLADPEYMSFHTIWLVTLLKEKRAIGILYFKDGPSDTGLVELAGYFEENSRKQGYMLEAYSIVRQWAFSKKEVCMMVAHVKPNDEDYLNMLLKLGFSRWLEHEPIDGPQLWCFEKPIRSTARIGIFIGIALGISGALLAGIHPMLGFLTGGIVGFLICAYCDGNAKRKRLLLLNRELSSYVRPKN